jgi:hypothetical protein
MPFCLPYLRALRRGQAASVLLGGVLAAFALCAAIALAQMIDLRLQDWSIAAQSPYALILVVALFGFVSVALLRMTLHNRRSVWIGHTLGEKVAAHEIWSASEPAKRVRSMAAVAEVARSAGHPASRALADAPWALAVINCAWVYDANLAAIASVVAWGLILWTLIGLRQTQSAKNFDRDEVARIDGENVLQCAAHTRDASRRDADASAAQWEATQRGAIAHRYQAAQKTARRQVVVSALGLAVAVTLGLTALSAPTAPDVTPGMLGVLYITLLVALSVLARCAFAAPEFATVRAARRHLLQLRVPATSSAAERHTVIRGPRQRGPFAAGLLAASSAAAGIAGIMIHIGIPLPTMPTQKASLSQTLQGTTRSSSTSTSEAVPRLYDREMQSLRDGLSETQQRLAALQREARTLPPTSALAQARLGEIEMAASTLTTHIKLTLERVAALERELSLAPDTPTTKPNPHPVLPILKDQS